MHEHEIEFQQVLDATSSFKRISVTSDVLKEELPNFYHGFCFMMDDLAVECGSSVKALQAFFDVLIEIENDGFENILVVRVPMLERIIGDKDRLLSESTRNLSAEEKESLRRMDLIK